MKRSLVFPILLFSSISLHCSLRKAFLSLLAILWNSAFRCLYLSFSPSLFVFLLFTAICKASSDSYCFFAFLFHGDGLDPCLLYNVTNLCPSNFPGKNTGMGCHFLLQGIFSIQGSNLCLLHPLHWQADSLPLGHLGSSLNQTTSVVV